MSDLLSRAGHAAATHWKRYTALTALLLCALAATVALTAGSFDERISVPGTASQRAYDLLDHRFPQAAGDGATIVVSADKGPVLKGVRAVKLRAALKAIERQPHVVSVTSPLTRKGAGQVSSDGRVAFATVQYDKTASELGQQPTQLLVDAAEPLRSAGVDTSYRGPIVDIARQAPVVSPTELIGLAVAMVVLTIALGSFAGMGVTLLVSLGALGSALGLILIASGLTAIPAVAMTLALMLGLGVGIDYALLIAARHREALSEDPDVATSAARANRTAGVAVIAAASIVVVAICGLLVVGIPFIGKMGLATGVAVAIVAAGAVLLLPMGLGAAGRRMVPRKAAHIAAPPFFKRWVLRLVRRPLLPALAATAVLLALAAPALGLRLGTPDDGVRSADATQRVAYDLLARNFGPGLNGPLLISAQLPKDHHRGRAAIRRLEKAVRADEGVVSVSPAIYNPAGDVAILEVIPTTSPQAQETSDLIKHLRGDVVPGAIRESGAQVFIGGQTATNDDMSAKIGARLPLFIGLVVVLAVLLLMAAFRSVRVPLVSAAFNLLSVFAAYGLVVLVFQNGVGNELLGIEHTVPIVSFLPLFMFALLFGLSMDYNVFQQSRIREAHAAGDDAKAAVVAGVAGTSKVIAAAGAIMVSVFASFMLSEDVVIKMMAFGLTAAILVDVLLIRFLLAPAVMSMLGEKAWTLPRWLDRVLPKIALEGAEEAAPRQPRARRPANGAAPHGA